MTVKTLPPDCSALLRYAATPVPKDQRPRGRPKTRTGEHYAALHAEYLRIVVWFESMEGRPHKSDAELLTAYFGARHESAGLRRGRATEPGFAGKLKTLRNELSAARAWLRNSAHCPVKSTFTGTQRPSH
jgi:hypothetical protein